MAEITGTNEGDTTVGTDEADVLFGLDGDDTMDGGAGNDELSGKGGSDSAAGGLGDDLLVSPDHALFLDGVLVHAGAPVNGASIQRETVVPERWPYWHVELADRALVLAEGVAAESFVDNADRLAFDNRAEHRALHPEGQQIKEVAFPRAKSWRQVPQGLRRRLAARAAARRWRPDAAAGGEALARRWRT